MRRFRFIMLLWLIACDPSDGENGPPTEPTETEEGSGDHGTGDGSDGTEDEGSGDNRKTDFDDTEIGSTSSPTEKESDPDNDTGASDTGNTTEDPDDSDADEGDTQSETAEDDTGPIITCPEGSERHESAEGEIFCCPESYPVFCDTRDGGYPGGCWSNEVDCASITWCGDDWSACHEGGMPFCDAEEGLTCYPCDDPTRKYETSSGRPFCCTEDHPLFCDENDDGYKGGCWSPAIDCGTVIECDDFWGACLVGLTSSCTDKELACLPEE